MSYPLSEIWHNDVLGQHQFEYVYIPSQIMLMLMLMTTRIIKFHIVCISIKKKILFSQKWGVHCPLPCSEIKIWCHFIVILSIDDILAIFQFSYIWGLHPIRTSIFSSSCTTTCGTKEVKNEDRMSKPGFQQQNGLDLNLAQKNRS